MLQRVLMLVLLALSLVTVAAADLEVLSRQDARFNCEAMVVEEKTFIAQTEEIHVGLWCSETANVLLYECTDLDCLQKTYLNYASKIDGSLATVIGFDVGTRYNYECYECPVDPTLTLNYDSLTIQEGQNFELMASCTDSKGRIGSLQFDGWLKSNRKVTDYDDAGEYSARITCGDQNGLSVTEELIVTVEDVNRPPTVHAVLLE